MTSIVNEFKKNRVATIALSTGIFTVLGASAGWWVVLREEQNLTWAKAKSLATQHPEAIFVGSVGGAIIGAGVGFLTTE